MGETRKLKWKTTLLLSIIVGWLGVDRFYMGHTLFGLLKLVTAGGFGIWWIIDAILVGTKHQFEGVDWK